MESLVNEYNPDTFFTGKRIFITGHTGFKGSWLLLWLHLLGAKTKGYALSPERAYDFYNKISGEIPHESVIADIRNKKRLAEEIQDFQPDFIFHLAAQPLVRKSYQIPSETFEINVIGTANVLEAVSSLEKKCTAIIITTDKVYENLEKNVAYKESDRLGGFDPYSASKACAEIVTASFIRSFFSEKEYPQHLKKIATVRAGNVIGGGDWNTDRIIPDIVNHLKKKIPVPVRSPEAIRPWQHVLEPLGGYLKLAYLLDEKGRELSTAFNFGPEEKDHLKVRELVDMSIELWGSGSWEDLSGNKTLHEAGILKLNIDLAKKELKWFPKLKSEEAIRWTIDWYKQSDESIFDFSTAQIKQYQSL